MPNWIWMKCVRNLESNRRLQSITGKTCGVESTTFVPSYRLDQSNCPDMSIRIVNLPAKQKSGKRTYFD